MTQTEAELAETVKSWDLAKVRKYRDYHYAVAHNELHGARHATPERVAQHVNSARLERGLARVARREIQRRRDEIEKDFV